MNSNLMQCDEQKLKRLLAADDHDIDHDPWMEHVEQCSQCQSRLRELAADDDQWRKAAAVLASDDEGIPCFGRGEEGTTSWNEAMARQLLQPPSHPEMLGRLGRYEMERMIGSGGMGIVFKAFDSELNRVVAVKVLAPYLSARGSARKRFAREARAAAGVRDDHVVPIYNVEPEHEPPFLVMQFVAGGSLQEKLDRDGPMEVAEVLRIGLQTAKGLAAAHAQGLIHRDVKPSNILLDEGVERALLTDFGLARAEDDACLTRSGFHPGTPHYMSPEQVRGEAIDGRSDLFSLGCVLYALCTGHSPFRADTSYAVMRRITDEAPRPIRELNSNIPQWLEAIVMKLLSKSRDDRFDSANQVAELLEACLAHVQEPTTTPLPAPVAKLVKSFGDHRNAKPAESLDGFRYPPIRKLIGLAAFAIFLLFGTIVFLESGKGTIRIETNSQSDVPIVIRQGDEIVEHLTVSKDGVTTRLKAGSYVMEVDGDSTNFEINGNEVTLKRGETWLATIQSQSSVMNERNTKDASDVSDASQERSRRILDWLRECRHVNLGATIIEIQDQLDDQGFIDLRDALTARSDNILLVPMSKADPLYDRFTFHGIEGLVCLSVQDNDALANEISDLLKTLYTESAKRQTIAEFLTEQDRRLREANQPGNFSSPQELLTRVDEFGKNGEYDGLVATFSDEGVRDLAGTLLMSAMQLTASVDLMKQQGADASPASDNGTTAVSKVLKRWLPHNATADQQQAMGDALSTMFGLLAGATPDADSIQGFIAATRKSAESISDHRKFAAEMMQAFEQLSGSPFVYFGEHGHKPTWQVTPFGDRATATLVVEPSAQAASTNGSPPLTTITLRRVNGTWRISSLFNNLLD